MKKRSRLIAELTENCWAIYPEQYSFMLNLLLGNIAPDKAMAEEMREKNRAIQEENSNMIGDTGIAYIPLMGTIYPRSNYFTEVCGGVSLTELNKSLSEALNDPSVKGIIFDVDGPGGAATGVNEFTNTLFNSRGTKPMYAYVGGTAASGALQSLSENASWFMGGLSAAGGMMRFVGFAVLLKIMLSNDLWGWLLGGFATALLFGNVEATASACLILVAFIGVAIALLDFKITSIETKAAQGGVSDGI